MTSSHEAGKDAGSSASVGEIQSVAANVSFNQFCQLFERLQKAKNVVTRKKELQSFMSKWRSWIQQLKQPSSESLFPALRLILPQIDNERPSYGVKETMLAKLYIDVLTLARNGPDAKRLLEYQNPKANSAAGDFAEVAYRHVLLNRCISKGSLNVAQVNTFLDRMANFNHENKKDQVRKTLLELVRKSSALEQKWLIRILLKSMKLQLGQKMVLLLFHPDAEDLYNVTTNLKQVCERLQDPNVRLDESGINLFQPFRPMLALNAKLEEVEKLMERNNFTIEIKYDGERSQLHMSGSKYKYFSRSGKEYSAVFGETPHTGTLTPHLHPCLAPHVTSCIIDGEMMAFDPQLEVYVQKGGPFDIKHVTTESDLQPCLVAYDLVYLNGEGLATRTQAERSRLLSEVVARPTPGRFVLAESVPASTNQEVVAKLNEAIDRREEGVMVKNMTSQYRANARSGSGWFKIKPEYVGGVVDDLDLVVIGASFGTGRHGHFLSMFHLAVGVPTRVDSDGVPTTFKSFCRVGCGRPNNKLIEVTEKLKPKLKVFQKKKIPPWLELSKEKPDVIIHPRDSLVVQVRGSEILPSTSYAAGVTLRFPRMIQFRDDKSPSDALHLDQLLRLHRASGGKLAARHATLRQDSSPPATKRRRMRGENQPSVLSAFRGTDLSTVEVKSRSFDNLVFCVITGTPQLDKQTLESRIVENGGKIVQNPTPNTHCVVARALNHIRVKNCVKAAKHDVVTAEWMVRSLSERKLLPWKPSDLLHASATTRERFDRIYDRYGDCFDQEVSAEQVRELFTRIDATHASSSTATASTDVKLPSAAATVERYDAHFSQLPYFMFCAFTFHIHSNRDGGDDSHDEERVIEQAAYTHLTSLVRFYGARVSDVIDDASHVITIEPTHVTLERLRQLRRHRDHKFRLVTHQWVHECVTRGHVVCEDAFAL